MTSNREKAAEIIGCEYMDAMSGPTPSAWRGQVAKALSAAGVLAPDLPKATINPVDGNPEWKPKELHLVEVDWGEVTYWIEGQPFTNTPKEAREIARSLEAAADYAEEEARGGEAGE